jgi:XapX domain-containing protein
MKIYLVSLAAGLLVGAIYSIMGVRSPAPPLVALLGLLGMLIGGQVVPVAERLFSGKPMTFAWFNRECAPSITGAAPPGAQEKGE